MVYLVLIDEAKNATLGGVFEVVADAEAHGYSSLADDFHIISNFNELNPAQQLSVYNNLAGKYESLSITPAEQFASKIEGNDRITHAIGKMSKEEIDALLVVKKTRKRKARDIVGVVTLTQVANSDDKIWRKASSRYKALEWLKANSEKHAGQIPLDEAVKAISDDQGITLAQTRGLLDKLRSDNAIKVSK